MTKLALRMGITAFGGPAAHIAILRHEAVAERKWVSEREFLDYLSLSNLIPGPNSTELIMNLGARRGGTRGLIAAGLAFITPAALITLMFAWAYQRWGATARVEGFLQGLAPALIVVIIFALTPLARASIRTGPAAALVAVLVALYLAGVNELLLLLLGTALYLAPLAVSVLRDRVLGLAIPLVLFAVGDERLSPEVLRIFLVFLKVGSILYGSGYVLIAFLQRDLVDHRHWLSQQQLLDAVAIGQVTPGPLFTTSTFIGYLVGGWDGALVATVGIFLPAFLFVLATHRFVDRMRESTALSRALDGLNLASNALLIGVLLTLLRSLDRSLMQFLVATVATTVLASRRTGPTPVLIAAGLIGSVWTAF